MDARRIEPAIQRKRRLRECANRIGLAIGVGVRDDIVDIRALRCELDGTLEISHTFIWRRTMQETARSPKQVAVNIVRCDGQKIIEHLNPSLIFEEPPICKALSGERSDTLWRDRKPCIVALENGGLGVRVHLQYKRIQRSGGANGVRISTAEQLSFNSPAVAFDFGR